jgi:hypothetical protein
VVEAPAAIDGRNTHVPSHHVQSHPCAIPPRAIPPMCRHPNKRIEMRAHRTSHDVT